MSDFRDKLVALGRGKGSLGEVREALETLVASAPDQAPDARKLLDRARRGGLPDKVHQSLVSIIDRGLAQQAQDDATVMSPRGAAPSTSPAWAETVVADADTLGAVGAEDGAEDATVFAGGEDAPTVMSNAADDGDATVMSGDDDATVMSEAGDDATVVSGADGDDATVMRPVDVDDEATRMSPRGAANAAAPVDEDDDATRINADGDATVVSDADDDEDATRMNRPASDDDDDATAFNPAALDDDATMVSPREIDAAFDILDPESMAAADSARQATTGASYVTDASQPAMQMGEVEFREGSLLRNRFILEKKLGEGGMGAVWKGVDKLKQEARDRNPYVAIKLLQGDFRDHPEAFIALQRETAKQQRLAHPNIATVFDFDRDDNTSTVFMTMEVLSGDDLAAFIRRKMPAQGLPYDEAMELIEQLGSGLSYAHQAGLVHSDLKPGNCFLTEENTVKLLDFGIARASKTKSDAEGETTVFDPGELGALTPAYATIEMFEGVDPDPRDDIYAMAIIAYQLLTGKHPYGKKNAPKAEEAGLTVPPVDKLTKRQNRALAQGLAFRRDDRIETVEELLDGLRVRKRNLVTTVVLPLVAAAAIVGGVTPVVLETIAEQEREDIIGTITAPGSLEAGIAQTTALEDPNQRRLILVDDRTRTAVISLFTDGGEAGIDRGLKLIRGVSAGFTEDIKGVAAVEDAVVDLYRSKVDQSFSPANDRLDYAGAEAAVERLRSIYPRAAGTFRLEQELVDLRAETLASVEDQFNQLVDAGSILPSATDDDIFKLRDRALAVDPSSTLATSKLVTLTAGELAQRAIEDQDFEKAQALLTASLDFAPEQDELGDLRYQVEQELERQRNAQLVAEIEARLRAQAPTFTTLAAFQDARDDLIRLADLAPASEVLQELQAQLTSAFDAELAGRIEAKDWPAAEALLVDFAKIFNLDYLEAKRTQLTTAESAAGFELAMTPEREAEVASRLADIDELVAQPDFGSDWEIALQVPFKEMIALLPADDPAMAPVRERIAELYIQEAEAARSNELTSRARSLVSRGNAFFPGYAGFDRQLGLIAETDALIERKRAEAARVSRVQRNVSIIANKARANDTQAAEAALTQLEKDATDAEADAVEGARNELGLAYGRLAELPAGREDWGAALKLIERGLELAPGSEALVQDQRAYDAEYQKVAAIERFKELLTGDRALDRNAVNNTLERVKRDFPERYATRYKGEFAALAEERLAGLPVGSTAELNRAGNEIAILKRHFPDAASKVTAPLARRMVSQVGKLEAKDVNAAAQYLAAARKIAPNNSALAGIKLKLPDPRADEGRKLVAAGQLTAAEQILATVTRESPQAPNLPAFRADLLARKQAAEQNFQNFEKYRKARRARQGKPFLDRAIQAWNDNPAYASALAALGAPAQPVNRFACDPRKAGLGSNNRATCYDNVGGSRGPVLVVVPAGGGSDRPFAIGKHEVNIREYNVFCRATGCAQVDGEDKLPVTGISLSQAEAYTKWLSEQSGARYRLPTSGEWQHAANAGGKQPRKDFNCTVTVGNQTLKGLSLVPANSGRNNGWGLINYVGNAKEWTRSGGGVAASGGAHTDPMSKCDIQLQESHNGNADPVTGFRVMREIG